MIAESRTSQSTHRGTSALRFAFETFHRVEKDWVELAGECPASTIYQRRPWLTALVSTYGFDLRAATLREPGGQVVAGALFARGKNPFARKWTSLPCSDSAPLLTRDEQAGAELLDCIAASELASEGLVEIRGSAAFQPWQTVNCFTDWQLDLDRPMAAIERSMAGNFRRQLRRGLEGSYQIEVGRTLENLRCFYRLMLLTRQRLGMPTQPWRFFKQVFLSFSAAGELEVWICSQGGMPVVAMVMLCDGPDVHYKWSARLEPTPPGATHVLMGVVLENYSKRYRCMNLGRADQRNLGLTRFKKEVGAKPYPLPYTYMPRVPANVSPEVHSDSQRRLSELWRRLPLPITRMLGAVLYRYLV